MIADSYIVPECAVTPGSFGGLMALYESNFIKLKLLVGQFGTVGECRLSTTPADCDLYFTVESTTRYTHVLRLSYLFDEDGETVADPDLVIRVYLDAGMAEVAGWAACHRHVVLRELERHYRGEIDRRWSRNMMLGKWLDYLLDAGHTLDADAPERRRIVGATID